MVTFFSLIMVKVKIDRDIWNLFLQKYLSSSPLKRCDYIKIQSADRIFVFLSADKHHFAGRLKLLH